jgi:hypothetical protein
LDEDKRNEKRARIYSFSKDTITYENKVEHILCQSSSAPHSWVVERGNAACLATKPHDVLYSNLFSHITKGIYSATSQGRLASNVDWILHFWRLVREPLPVRSAIRSALDDA